MIYAIVPVKALSQAKGRLAQALTDSKRQSLVLAMLADVLTALRGARTLAGYGVISDDMAVLTYAAELGAEALIDQAPDLNSALADAARFYTGAGATGLLILPADIPLVTASDIDVLVASAPPGRGVVVAPSSDGGTNGLFVRPPLALPFLFGLESLARHLQAAHDRGLPVRLFESPRIALDVDQPEDLVRLVGLDGTTRAGRLAYQMSHDELWAGRWAGVE
jgi:2-phospho-L-lactate guanylyltransferase